MHRTFPLLLVVALAACTSTPPARTAPTPREPELVAMTSAGCTHCQATPMTGEIAQELERRIAALRERGGACAHYGTVLERSYQLGRIRVRPFMWRVGPHLASGESRPDGEMILARDIDSLNVGVRTLDEVISSIEHEAAHIAFDITRSNGGEERAAATVRECRDRPRLPVTQDER